MSSLYPRNNVEKIRITGIFLILMTLCVGSVSGELVIPMYTTPNDIAQSLVGSGVTISNVQFTGFDAYCAGTFTGGTGIIGFEDGAILSSGDIVNVIGPNDNEWVSGYNGMGGDTDLGALDLSNGGNGGTSDACILEFDLTPQYDVLQFEYVFASDEYSESVNFPEFGDVFGFFVDGENVALIPGTIPPVPVTVNNVNLERNVDFFINNDNTVSPQKDTQMDGLTKVLTAKAQVTPNQLHHIKLAIADTNDDGGDSNVFIKAGSFTSPNNVNVPEFPTLAIPFGAIGVLLVITLYFREH